MKKFIQSLIILGAPILALAVGSQADATGGTLAGTTISNTASVGYSIGGVAQTAVSSNTATFLVDRKANVTVAQVGGVATMTSYTATSQVLTFTVTNTTNATQDIRLYALDDALLTSTALGHSDTFLPLNLRVYVDSNGNGTYDPGVDTATYIDELAPDSTKTVFVVADMPSTGVAGGVGGVYLTAVVAAGGTPGSLGVDLTPSLLADNPNAVDTVFADGNGWADLARDGKFSADGEYDIYGTMISATKTATLISDPLDGTVLPKAIPGAVIEYCIAVKNISTTTLSSVVTSDSIPANTTYVTGSIYSGGTVLAGVCNPDGSSVSDASGYSGTTVSTTAATLLPGVTSTTRFRVTLN